MTHGVHTTCLTVEIMFSVTLLWTCAIENKGRFGSSDLHQPSKNATCDWLFCFKYVVDKVTLDSM
jgi:hypothetical protein